MVDLQSLLVEKGISPSLHRLKILEYIAQDNIHPSAEEIYQSLIGQIPTLSRTTIYNTLKTLLEKGIVSSFSANEKEVRYEFNHHPHAHFKCYICNRLFDLEVEFKCYQNQMVEGHRIEKQQVSFYGICRDCLKEEKS